MIYLLTPFVIQRSIATKDLVYIHFMLPRFFLPLVV